MGRLRLPSAADFPQFSAGEKSVCQRRQQGLGGLVPRSLLDSLALLCLFRFADAAAQNNTPAGCDDEVDWKDSTYGTGCSFYARHDPGCRKYADLGQIARCNVDNGKLLPANWEGGHKARVLFGQGPVQARLLRIYPNTTVGDASWVLRELSAVPVVRRCATPVVLTDS